MNEGIITKEKIAEIVKKEIERETKIKTVKEGADLKIKNYIFAAMPFSIEYDDTFFLGMAYAADQIGAVCRRVDYTDFTGDIVDQIKELIKKSDAAIIDLSEAKPNVLFEAGFAHALGIPAIHICSTPVNELPFDVAHWNTIEYKKGSVTSLRPKLINRLKKVLKVD